METSGGGNLPEFYQDFIAPMVTRFACGRPSTDSGPEFIARFPLISPVITEPFMIDWNHLPPPPPFSYLVCPRSYPLFRHPLRVQHPLLPRFKGEVLFAPAIKGNPPPSLLVSFLRYFVVPLIPRWEIPSCLESGAMHVSVGWLAFSSGERVCVDFGPPV